jgi:uncharacterized repeat protein (TIGR03803 family)
MDGTGNLVTLHTFACNTAEGCQPRPGLIQAGDGFFYGTTALGGAANQGTVFKADSAGVLTTLHAFACSGSVPSCQPSGLTQAGAGTFYGTTAFGGEANQGTVFKMDSAGSVTTLHSFACSTEGCQPNGLVRAGGGTFYGTTTAGGEANQGTVFKMDGAGSVTTLHSFACSADGCQPNAGLIQASDGNVYGTTQRGGPAFGGVVFRLAGDAILPTTTALTALSPARVWVGLANSNNVGLGLDLLAEVFVDSVKAGEGRLDNVSLDGRGFDHAILYSIPLALTQGPVEFPGGAALEITLSARRACSGGNGHNAGKVGLWYNGQPVDGGAAPAPGSRFGATIGGTSADYFLRGGFALSTEPGTSSESTDVRVQGKGTCPARAFTPFGTWSMMP